MIRAGRSGVLACLAVKRTLTLLLLVLVAAACNGDGNTTILQLLSPQDANLLVQAHDGDPAFGILDVRTPGEHSAGYLEDAGSGSP